MESDIENSSEAQPKEEVKKNATGTLNPDEIRELAGYKPLD